MGSVYVSSYRMEFPIPNRWTRMGLPYEASSIGVVTWRPPAARHLPILPQEIGSVLSH
jgi:hypothetical protein